MLSTKSYQATSEHVISGVKTNEVYDEISSDSNTSDGLSVWTSAVFITAIMAGMGVLALPYALAGTGWWGLALIFLASANSWYSAILLGRVWDIMEKTWPEYKGKIRYPYPAIAFRALGPWLRYTVTILLHISFIGIATVYLLLSAQIAVTVTTTYFSLSYNLWVLLLGLILCPLTWFGRISEFSFAAYGALITATVGCCSLFIDILMQKSTTYTTENVNTDFGVIALAFGTIVFSFGGTFFFPSVHNDMKHREQFPKSSALGFTGLMLLYLPVTIAGYAVMGDTVPVSMLLIVEPGAFFIIVQLSFAIHVFLAFLLLVNPIAQEVEEVLHMEPSFNWKRCCIRSLIVAVIILVAYTVPHFEVVLNLIGGSTFTLLTYILPSTFYILMKRKTPLTTDKHISIWERLVCAEMIIFGLVGGTACTYYAINQLIVVLKHEVNSSISTV